LDAAEIALPFSRAGAGLQAMGRIGKDRRRPPAERRTYRRRSSKLFGPRQPSLAMHPAFRRNAVL